MRALELVEVGKFYPPRSRALKDVSFSVEPATITALLGMNGAGKSTVVKLLTGVERPTSGNILIDGKPVDLGRPTDAETEGIGVVHQELPLLNALSAAENMALGRESRHGQPLLSSPNMSTLIRQYNVLAQRFPSAPKARQLVGDLPLRQRQLVAIIRALWGQAHYLLFDEPTTSLDTTSREALRTALTALANDGAGLLYVTHFLDEALTLAHRVVVLRDGLVVMNEATASVNLDSVVRAMTGALTRDGKGERPVSVSDKASPRGSEPPPTDRASSSSECLLEVTDFKSANTGPISIRSFTGQILGLYGTEDCGAEEVLQGIAGLAEHSGSVRRGGSTVKHDVRERLLAGIVLVTGDRKRMLFDQWSVYDNLFMSDVSRARWWRRPPHRNAAKAFTILNILKVKGTASDRVTDLSGGNQQKLLIGRLMNPTTKVCLAMDPSRGIDIVARREIHTLLKQFVAASGVTMLICSRDPQEIVDLANRAFVLREGRIVTELMDHQITTDALETLSLGL